MILMYIFESYLDVRQHAAHKLPTLPKPLVGVISQEKFEKSRAYSLDKSYFHFIHEFVTILMDSSILYFRILPWFWKRSGEFLVYLGLNAENEIYHTLSFLAGVMVWSQVHMDIFLLPISKKGVDLFAELLGRVQMEDSIYFAVGFKSYDITRTPGTVGAWSSGDFAGWVEAEEETRLRNHLKWERIENQWRWSGHTPKSDRQRANMLHDANLGENHGKSVGGEDQLRSRYPAEVENHRVKSVMERKGQSVAVSTPRPRGIGKNELKNLRSDLSEEVEGEDLEKNNQCDGDFSSWIEDMELHDPHLNGGTFTVQRATTAVLRGRVNFQLLVQITDLPFSLYSTFVIEARHGFNKQTVWLYFRDMIKGIALSIVIGPPIVAAIIVIVQYEAILDLQKGGPYLAIYLWGFILILSLVMMTIYPVLIAPLFNKFTPLPQGELRLKIENLASSLKFPLKKLFVVDGSTRSSHSNAYMYGFFKNKRIVLYDTLIQQCKNDEEIVAVIAHELGHWKLNHTMYSFIAVQVGQLIREAHAFSYSYFKSVSSSLGSISLQILTVLQFGGYTLVRNSKDLFQSFGFDTQPVLIGLIIFQHTVIPLQHLVSFGLNLVSRAFEFQADAFAKKLGYAAPLRAGLVILQEENLSAMNTDPWYSAYHYSHPPLVERLAAIDESDKKTE
ncbi:hypothetical protein H5410_011898 [Solanum commersonii]|uniref:CAAX prenyl protease 1 homolog n=1 Tax=Solanum commersonii TaxID=4109 RepID=A0A9J6APV1_SOLCO|nr:hypothetical protein H5410_011898 [Solanum commersonii]